jgi:hypothetical protein
MIELQLLGWERHIIGCHWRVFKHCCHWTQSAKYMYTMNDKAQKVNIRFRTDVENGNADTS